MRWISNTKLKVGSLVLAGTVVSGLGGAVLFNGVAHGEWDLPGLNQQVQNLTEVSANHESRISNAENDIKNLQTTTGTTPAPNASQVPTVVTQPAPQVASTQTLGAETAPVATPAPVAPRVVQYEQAGIGATCPGGPNLYFSVLWSDGTTTTQVDRPTSGHEGSGSVTSCTNKQL